MRSYSIKCPLVQILVVLTSTVINIITLSPVNANETLLTTGRDKNDSQRYWQCHIVMATSNEGSNTFPLRMWASKQGFIGENKMNWQTSSDHLVIQTDQGQLLLSNVNFFDPNDEREYFTAVSNDSEELRCDLKGPSRTTDSTEEIFDDGANSLEAFLHSNASLAWTCEMGYESGIETSTIEFSRFGLGVANDTPFTWFFDPDRTLFITNSPNLGVLDNFQIITLSSGHRSFRATVFGKEIECETFI